MLKSSVPYFKRALLARIKANPNVTGQQLVVSWGNPYPLTMGRELVVIGNTENRQRTYTAGLHQARETYDIDVLVSIAEHPLNDMDARETKAYEIADAIEGDLVAWNLSAAPLVAGDFGTVDICLVTLSADTDSLDSVDAIDVREGTVTLKLSVTARLTDGDA